MVLKKFTGKLYYISFYGNPNTHPNRAHRDIVLYKDVLIKMKRNFLTKEEALNFWYECYMPITQEKNIIRMVAKQEIPLRAFTL